MKELASAIRIARTLRRAPSGCAVAQAVSLRSAPQSALLAPSGAPPSDCAVAQAVSLRSAPHSALLAPSVAPLRTALSRRLSHSVRLRIPHCSRPPARPSGCAVAQAVSLRSAPQSALSHPPARPFGLRCRAGGLTPFGSAIRIARALRRAPSGCAVAQAVSLRSAPQSALLAPSGAPLRAALSRRLSHSVRLRIPHCSHLPARPFGLRCRAGCLTPFGSAFRIPHPAGANGATILQPKPPAHKRQRVLRPPGWPRWSFRIDLQKSVLFPRASPPGWPRWNGD